MAAPVFTLQIIGRLTEAIPEGGVNVVTRLSRHAGMGTWEVVSFDETVFRGATSGVMASFDVPSDLYSLDFRISRPKDLEGYVITYEIVVVDLAGPFDMGAVTIDQTFGIRRVFYLSDHAPYITKGSVVPQEIELPPVPEEPITGGEDEPWWGPVTDFFGSLGSGLINGVLNVGNALLGAITPVTEFFKDPVGNLITGLPGLFKGVSDAFARRTTENLLGLLEGTPDWVDDIKASQDGIYLNFGSVWAPLIQPSRWLPEEPTLENYYSSAQDMANTLINTDVRTSLLAIVTEIMTAGQVEGFMNLYDELMNLYGVSDIVKPVNTLPIQKGILVPYEHAVNYVFPNELPTVSDLINMVVKEKLPLDAFKEVMRQQGYKEQWSDLIWDAHYIAPDYTSVRMAYHRGNLDEDEVLAMLKRVDFDPEFNEKIWLPNLWEIPPYTDLINMRVKEVISEPVFAQYLRWHGFDPVWAGRLWDAHFMPPTQGDIITAWRRKIPVTIPEFNEATGQYVPREVDELSLADLHKLMVLVDLDPRYTSIFDTRLYNDPTIRQARYMYESGAIGPDVVREIVRRSGMSPEYIDPMTDYLTEFTEREYRRRYLTALQTGVISGVFTADDLTVAVQEAGFPEGVAKWMLATADVRRKISEAPKAAAKPKLLSVSDLKRAYVKDYINETDLRTRLDEYGYEYGDIDLMVTILNDEKVIENEGRQQVALTSAQLINAYRYNQISRSDLRDRLMLKGLDYDEAELIISTKEKQWGVGGE